MDKRVGMNTTSSNEDPVMMDIMKLKNFVGNLESKYFSEAEKNRSEKEEMMKEIDHLKNKAASVLKKAEKIDDELKKFQARAPAAVSIISDLLLASTTYRSEMESLFSGVVQGLSPDDRARALAEMASFRTKWDAKIDGLADRSTGALVDLFGDEVSEAAAMQARRTTARPVVLAGPSGGGKSSILTRAMQEFKDAFAFSVSHTTRISREGEQHGVDYWFSSVDELSQMIIKDEFLEHATFGGNTYGTSKKSANDVLSSGRIAVFDVELEGVRNLKKSLNAAKCIFIRAPSIDELEKRLRARGTETEETLQKRLKHAREDMEEIAADKNLFDYEIVNDDLDSAYQQFLNALSEDLPVHQMNK